MQTAINPHQPDAPLPLVAAAIGKYRWVICALLFLATTINYIDRQILSLLKETLDHEIGWSNTQFGLVNSVFQFAYAMGLLGFGWFVDRFGTKIGYTVSIVAWSLSAAAHALVGTVGGFLAARASLGLGEGGNFPVAVKAVALWFPRRERALATSIFNAGTNAGALIAPATIPWLAERFGWQSAFVAAGIAGLLWLFLWIPFYEVPERSRYLKEPEMALITSDRDEAVSQEKIPWLSLLGYRETWSFIIAKFLTDPVWWFFLIWLPDFFKKTKGLEIKKSWIHIVMIYGIITVLSIGGGWLTGYLTKRGWTVTRARKTGMFLFALCVVPILAVTSVGEWSAVLLIGLAGAAHQAWSATLYTSVSDMFPKRAVASVIGIGGMAGSVGGIMFPLLTGKMLDHFEKLHNATAGYSILFGICSCMYLVAFVFHHLAAPRLDPVRLR